MVLKVFRNTPNLVSSLIVSFSFTGPRINLCQQFFSNACLKGKADPKMRNFSEIETSEVEGAGNIM